MKFPFKKMRHKNTRTDTFFIVLITMVLKFPALGVIHQPTHFQDEKRVSWNIGHTTLSLSGCYRLRGEFQKEFNIKNYRTNQIEYFLLSRLRLQTDLRFSQRFRLHFQLQDSRVSGLSLSNQNFASGTNPFHGPLDINQGYFEGQLFTSLKFKIGRQVISFRDWENNGRYAWDAAIITLKNRLTENNLIARKFIQHDPNRWPNNWVEGPTAFAMHNSFIYFHKIMN